MGRIPQSYQGCAFLGIQHNPDDSYNLYFKVGTQEIYYQLADYHQMEDMLHLNNNDRVDLSKGQIVNRFVAWITNNGPIVADFLGISDAPRAWKRPLRQPDEYEQMTIESQTVTLTKDVQLNQQILRLVDWLQRRFSPDQMTLSEVKNDRQLTITITHQSEPMLLLVIDYEHLDSSRVSHLDRSSQTLTELLAVKQQLHQLMNMKRQRVSRWA